MADSSNVVFAGNLSWTTSDEDLTNYVGGAGKVIKATVQRHSDTGRSKGWGLIEFADTASANAAIERFNFEELNGRKVHLRLDRNKVTVPENAIRVYVGNLPWEADDEMLSQLFSQYGTMDCSVMTNMTGKSRGFAIVTFNSQEQADRAIAEMQNKELAGRPIECRLDRGPGVSKAPKKSGAKTSVFVGNLPDAIDSDTLSNLFSQIAPVVSSSVRTQTGGGTGWGLIKYATAPEADRAIATFNGVVTPIGPDPLLVRYDRR